MSEGGVGSSFWIDTRDVRRIARKWGQPAERMLLDELVVSFGRAITAARREANRLIKGGEGSNLARASVQKVTVSGSDVTAEANWDAARSPEGFPYAAAVDRGRKAFGPKTAKALRFGVNGETVFAKWVKAAPAQNFTGKGLERSRARVVGEVNAGIARWADRMAAR